MCPEPMPGTVSEMHILLAISPNNSLGNTAQALLHWEEGLPAAGGQAETMVTPAWSTPLSLRDI